MWTGGPFVSCGRCGPACRRPVVRSCLPPPPTPPVACRLTIMLPKPPSPCPSRHMPHTRARSLLAPEIAPDRARSLLPRACSTSYAMHGEPPSSRPEPRALTLRAILATDCQRLPPTAPDCPMHLRGVRSGDQWPSVANSGHQWPSVVLSGDQWRPVATIALTRCLWRFALWAAHVPSDPARPPTFRPLPSHHAP